MLVADSPLAHGYFLTKMIKALRLYRHPMVHPFPRHPMAHPFPSSPHGAQRRGVSVGWRGWWRLVVTPWRGAPWGLRRLARMVAPPPSPHGAQCRGVSVGWRGLWRPVVTPWRILSLVTPWRAAPWGLRGLARIVAPCRHPMAWSAVGSP
jgi:hypothetical protein